MSLESFLPTMSVTMELSINAKCKLFDNAYSSSVNTKLFIHEYNHQCIETAQFKCFAHLLSATCHPYLSLAALMKNDLNESSTAVSRPHRPALSSRPHLLTYT
eukprot:14831748-Ditylum_brightwellii.AAC.1